MTATGNPQGVAASERLVAATARGVVDCDLHVSAPPYQSLLPYLSDYWQEQVRLTAFKGAENTAYPAGMPTSGPAPSNDPVADLDRLRAEALDPWRTEIGILQCSYAVEAIHNPDGAAAFASAVNDWIVEHWLAKEPRLRAALVVPTQQPDLAAREIDRLGGHPQVVQVFLPVRAEAPYGNRRYWPLYEAALRHDLVIGVHFGGATVGPPTPSGWPSYYLEEWVDMAATAQSQLVSLIFEGIFDRYPTLRVVFAETGFTWLPALLWRFDKEWKGLRRQTPWVRRPPSAYVAEHVRFTTQPWDAPANGEQFVQLFDLLGSDDLLLFATDYPHLHYDTPEEALPPAALPESTVRKIMRDNARAWYRFDQRQE